MSASDDIKGKFKKLVFKIQLSYSIADHSPPSRGDLDPFYYPVRSLHELTAPTLDQLLMFKLSLTLSASLNSNG